MSNTQIALCHKSGLYLSMLPLDPKRLLELLRIAQHGSFTGAAAALGVSQPALSNSIMVLERALGAAVLERHRRGAALTDIGRLLVSHAAAIESVLSRAREEVELKKRGLDGSLIIGVSPIACVDIVPDAIARLKRETPDVAVLIHERPDDELIEALRSGEIDVMIGPTGLVTDPPDIEREVLATDAFTVIMRSRHPLARRRSVTLAQLRNATWVMPHEHSTMWRQIEALFVAENEPWPADCISTNSITALKSLLMRSDAVSISSPRLVAIEHAARRLVCIKLRQRHFAREICLRKRRRATLTPVAQRFLAALRSR
jgi:LysR family transcriptional regulator, regulator of abg operon